MQKKERFNHLQVPLSPQIEVEGQQFLYFGGTAYLGIPQDELFIEYYLEGIKKYGLNNGTSRNNNVQLGIYAEAECLAAQKFATESALITSSGYLAAQLAITQLATFGTVRYAPHTHPALWQGEKPTADDSFTAWATATVQEINNSTQKEWVLISNSMNNLFPEIYDFSFIQLIDKNKQVVLIVDDSHGIGINNEGHGAFSVIPKLAHVTVIVVASMAKALGVDAGLVLGPKAWIDVLKQGDIFLGASPPAAAGLFAFTKADQIYHKALGKLQANMEMMAEALLGHADWHFVSGFPVFFCKNVELSTKLLKQHILVSSFSYPTKNSPPINRVVLSSRHEKNDIAQLIKSL